MDNQPTGGAATIGRRNSIQTARLKPLRSHGQLAQEAAAACTAGWPDAGSWEQQAQQEGRWIDGDPMTRRQDAEQEKNRQREIAQLVRSELQLAIRHPVEILSLKPNPGTGAVSGRFRSKGRTYTFRIGNGAVTYAPEGGERSDAVDPSWSAARIAGYREVMGSRADGDLEELQHQNEQADAYLVEINGGQGRADARMDARGDRVAPVAIRASAVLQALARINERLPGMTGPMRVLAQQARETALQALQSAGIDPTTSWAEAI